MPLFREQPQLLGPFRDGERWALERVYRAYVRPVEVYVRALARAAHCPEFAQSSAVADSLQEVFIRAFSPAARAAYDSERPFGPYVRKIAKNLFVDQLRGQGRRAEQLVEFLPDTTEFATADLDGAVDPRVSVVLSDYLASLPLPLKGVYEQRFVLGNSQEQACNVLGVTRRRLRTEEARLKSGLRRALVSQGILPADLLIGVGLARRVGP